MSVLVLTDDLIFSSKIEAAAKALNQTLLLISKPSQFDEALKSAQISVALVDLHSFQDAAIESVRRIRSRFPQARITGCCSHVQTELQRQAREAGCTWVLPRSVFVQQLPSLISGNAPEG